MKNIFKQTQTDEKRYDSLKIANYLCQHFGGINRRLIIVDVGCSDGSALTYCKDKRLTTKGIETYSIGIDPIAEKTSYSTLDKFIPKCAADIDSYVGEADVVICVNVLNWLHRLLLRRHPSV